MLVAAVLRPEEREDGQLERIRVPLEQVADTFVFPVRQAERAMERLFGDRAQVLESRPARRMPLTAQERNCAAPCVNSHLRNRAKCGRRSAGLTRANEPLPRFLHTNCAKGGAIRPAAARPPTPRGRSACSRTRLGPCRPSRILACAPLPERALGRFVPLHQGRRRGDRAGRDDRASAPPRRGRAARHSCSGGSGGARAFAELRRTGLARCRPRRPERRHPLHADRLGREAHRLGRRGDRELDRADLRRPARAPLPAERERDGHSARRRPRRTRRRRRARRARSRGRLVGGGRDDGRRRRLALVRRREPLHAAPLLRRLAARHRDGRDPLGRRSSCCRLAPLPDPGRDAERRGARLGRRARNRRDRGRVDRPLPDACRLRLVADDARDVPAAAPSRSSTALSSWTSVLRSTPCSA